MPSITIKGLTEETLKLIKKKAANNNRSLNKEIIDLLSRYAESRIHESKQILKDVDKVKSMFKGTLTSASINRTIRQGRK